MRSTRAQSTPRGDGRGGRRGARRAARAPQSRRAPLSAGLGARARPNPPCGWTKRAPRASNSENVELVPATGRACAQIRQQKCGKTERQKYKTQRHAETHRDMNRQRQEDTKRAGRSSQRSHLLPLDRGGACRACAATSGPHRRRPWQLGHFLREATNAARCGHARPAEKRLEGGHLPGRLRGDGLEGVTARLRHVGLRLLDTVVRRRGLSWQQPRQSSA